MMESFYDSFGRDADQNQRIPDEILKELNSELPENLMYIQNEAGECRVIPRSHEEPFRLAVKPDFDRERDAALMEKLNPLSPSDQLLYLYRTQQSIPVREPKIGDGDRMIPLEKTVGNPLQETNVTVTKARMFPEKFPEPVSFLFESKEGDQVSMKIQQQPWDSLTEIQFSNVNFPALKTDIYLYSPLAQVQEETAHTTKEDPCTAVYSVTPEKADTVSDALKALHIFFGLLDGTVSVNGKRMQADSAQSDFEPQRAGDVLAFWNAARALEEKLQVSFRPNVDFPKEERVLFQELDLCLNQGKQIVWKHPFDHFRLKNCNPVHDGDGAEDMIEAEGVSMRFVEGPIKMTLLGAEFEVYSLTTMQDFVVTNIQWDDEKKRSGEVYLSDAPDKVWTLQRRYMTKDEMEEVETNEKSQC